MSETKCPRCERTLNVESGAAFCPYCGAPIAQAETKPESEAVLALLNKLESMAQERRALIGGKRAMPVQSLRRPPPGWTGGGLTASLSRR